MYTLFTLALLLIVAGICGACGVTTHNVIANRALQWFPKSLINNEYHRIITSNIGAFQAGVAFPDWGYNCIAARYVPNVHEGSDLAHWAPFQKAFIDVIRKTPKSAHKDEMIAFLFGIVSHSIADILWHDLSYVRESHQGFIVAMEYSNCPNMSCAYTPHIISDFGGEFMAAYQVDLSFLTTDWKMPTAEVMKVYRMLNYTIELEELVLDSCVIELLAETQSIAKLPSEAILPYFDQMAPFLFAQYQDWWMGGVDSNALWTSFCWDTTINWLEHGIIPNNYCYPLNGPSYADQRVAARKLVAQTVKEIATNAELAKPKKAKSKFSVLNNQIRELRPKPYANSLFGHSVTECSDYIVVGAPNYDAQKGAVYLYDERGYSMIIHPSKGARFGTAMTCVDLDLDGYDDLVVGAPGVGAYPNMSYYGEIRVYSGKSQFASHYIVPGAAKYYNYGEVLQSADLNGDGKEDLIIGVPSAYTQPKLWHFGIGEIWYALANHTTIAFQKLAIPSQNGFGGWNRLGTWNAVYHNSTSHRRYIMSSMPTYNIRRDQNRVAVGCVVCYDITNLADPVLQWQITGTVRNGEFGYSFDIDDSNDNPVLAISAPAASDGLLGQGLVYVVNVSHLSGNVKIESLSPIMHKGRSIYARLGEVVRYANGTLLMTEPYYDEVGRVRFGSNEHAIDGTDAHSRFGYSTWVGDRILIGAPRDSKYVENGGTVFVVTKRSLS